MAETVLVSGGLGFIGLAVARNLVSRGVRVRLLDNLNPQIHGDLPRTQLGSLLGDGLVEIVRGDIRLRSGWVSALQGAWSVIHLAAETGTGQSMYRVADYTNTNVFGTSLLLDILANDPHHVRKIVLTSTRAVYGEGAYRCETCGIVYPAMREDASLVQGRWEPLCPTCDGPARSIATREDAKTSPSSIYAATKLAQEDLVRIAGNALGIPFSILRLQNVYGEGQSLNNPYTGILSVFSNRIRLGKPLALFEDGQESRDFVHVSDVAEAVCNCLLSQTADGLTMNVGSGLPTTIAAMASVLKRCFGGTSRIEVSGQYRAGDIRHCHADLTRIQSALDFRPKVMLEDGVAQFARWAQAQPPTADRLEDANRELLQHGLLHSSEQEGAASAVRLK